MPVGATVGSQGRVQAERPTWGIPLLGSLGAVLWGSQARAKLVNSHVHTVIFKMDKQQGPTV